MTNHYNRVGFSLQWIVANIASLALGLIFAGTLGQSDLFHEQEFFRFAIAGAAFGLAIGSVQWLALRQHLSRASWWILATTLGYSLGFLSILAVKYLLHYDIWEDVISLTIINRIIIVISLGMIVGLPVAITEWLVLRVQNSYSNFYLWIVICPLGMSASLTIFILAQRVMNTGTNINGIPVFILLLIIGVAFGMVTGIPLAQWLKPSSSE